MENAESLAIIKALADKSRLAIIKSLLERPHYVEELAKRHALAASTVSFHLRKLEQAGLISSRKEQYYVIIAVNDAVFDTTLRQIVTAVPDSSEVQEQRIDAYHRKVLATFFRNGRLQKLPTQHKKRLIVLQTFAARFEPGRSYSEQEATDLIAPLFSDYCTIRRLLVDEGLVQRQGASYRREEQTETAGLAIADVMDSTQRKTNKLTTRKEIIRTYKESRPVMGIYQIRCLENDKVYVASSLNLEGERNSRLFQLRMGKIVFSSDLQKDVQTYGAKAFTFEILEVLEPAERESDMKRALAKQELHWLEKLQSFADKGYNSEKKYHREKNRWRSLEE